MVMRSNVEAFNSDSFKKLSVSALQSIRRNSGNTAWEGYNPLDGTLSGLPVTAKTANYTITSSDLIITGNASSGAFALTFPAMISTIGKMWIIKNINTTNRNALTLSAGFMNSIDGASSIVSTVPNESFIIVCTASGTLRILAHYTPYGYVPVGGIFHYLKSLTGTPTLTAEYVELNGGTLTDALSPFNGGTLPNINGSGGGGVKRFIRGSTTSGTTGGADSITVNLNTPVSGDSAMSKVTVGPCDCAANFAKPAASNVSILPSYYEAVCVMRKRG